MYIIAVIIGFLSAYYAGKLAAIRDINRIEGRNPEIKLIVLEGLLILFSLYYMIALLGM